MQDLESRVDLLVIQLLWHIPDSDVGNEVAVDLQCLTVVLVMGFIRQW